MVIYILKHPEYLQFNHNFHHIYNTHSHNKDKASIKFYRPRLNKPFNSNTFHTVRVYNALEPLINVYCLNAFKYCF